MIQTTEHIEEIKMSVLVGLHFAVMAVMSYAVSILSSRGFKASQIGTLTAIPPLTSVVIQYVSGEFIDRSKDRIALIRMLRLFLLLGLIGMLLFLTAETSYGLMILAFFFFGFGMYSTSPLYSTLSIRYQENDVLVRYSLIRGIGSLVYGVGCAILGYIVQDIGSTGVIVFGEIALIVMLADCFLLRYKGGIREEYKAKPESRCRRSFPVQYYLYLGASLFLFIGHFMTNTYMIHIVNALGGDNRQLGYTQLILSVSEVPMALLFPKLVKKVHIKGLVLISGCFMFLKIVGNVFAPSLTVLMMVQTVQCLGNGLYWATSVYFVNSLVNKEEQVRGQSLLFIACSGISGFLASYAGGRILEYSDLMTLKIIAVMSGLIGMIMMCTSTMKIKNTAGAFV